MGSQRGDSDLGDQSRFRKTSFTPHLACEAGLVRNVDGEHARRSGLSPEDRRLEHDLQIAGRPVSGRGRKSRLNTVRASEERRRRFRSQLLKPPAKMAGRPLGESTTRVMRM